MKRLIIAHWNDKPCAVKLLCHKKDGSPFWAYIYTCPMTDVRARGARHHLCVIADITTSRFKKIGKYILGKVVGSGASGIVRKGKNVVSGEEGLGCRARAWCRVRRGWGVGQGRGVG